VKLKENRLDEAYKLQCRAVARQPDEPRQYLILSDVLSKMGRHDEAQGMLVQVAQMQALAKAAATAN
jgi:predicted Zn-dependent protease